MQDTIVKIFVIFGIVVVLCSPAACSMHRASMVKEAIVHGADPMSTKCAMEIGDTTSQVCRDLVQPKIIYSNPPAIIYEPRVNPGVNPD